MTSPHMFELARRGVEALESIAETLKSLDEPQEFEIETNGVGRVTAIREMPRLAELPRDTSWHDGRA